MSIRLIDPTRDMDRVIELYQTCFAEPPWNERFDGGELRAEFTQKLSWPDAIFLVAEDDNGQVIGGALGFHVCRKPDVCERIPDVDRNSFYVAELFVDPAARVRGVCRKMNIALLELARRFGYSRASVRTSVEQGIIQHLFVGGLAFTVVARQDVVSTKWIYGIEQQVPDTRVLMCGAIPGMQTATNVLATRV